VKIMAAKKRKIDRGNEINGRKGQVGDVKKILFALAALAEKENRDIYIVGGFVRDALRGLESRDVDLIVSEEADQFAKRAAWLLRGEYELLESFSQYARVTLAAEDGRPVTLDISLRQGKTVEEDLRRRDFTVNAMAIRLGDYLAGDSWSDRLVDPCGGASDLREKTLRLTSAECLQLDPVRFFRAVRFSLRLGLELAPESLLELRKNAHRIRQAQKMKLALEFFQLLAQPYAAAGLRMLQTDLEVLPPFFPPFYRMAVQQDNGETLFDHGIQTCLCLEDILGGKNMNPHLQQRLHAHLAGPLAADRPRAAYLRLACLVHDIGKVDGGRCGEPPSPSFNHEVAAESYLLSLSKRLLLSEEEEMYLINLVVNHSRSVFLNVEEFGPRLRFFRQFHTLAPEMILLSMANHAARYGHDTPLAADLASLLDCYFRGEFRELPEPFLSAREIMEFFHLPPIRPVGGVLEKVYCAQLEGRVKNKKEAMNMVSRLLDERVRHG
jgi:poly(A) polymerase